MFQMAHNHLKVGSIPTLRYHKTKREGMIMASVKFGKTPSTEAKVGKSLGPGVYRAVDCDDDDGNLIIFVVAKGKAIGIADDVSVEIAQPEGWLDYKFVPLDTEVTITFGPDDVEI